MSFNRILALAKRNFKEIVREPVSLIFLLALPLVMLVLFYYLFHNATSQFEMSFLAPAMVVFGQSFLSLFVGLLISVDRSSSLLMRLYTSPCRPYEFVLGYTLAVLPVGLAQTLLFFAVACIIDVSFLSLGLLWAFLLSLVPMILFVGFGILIGSLVGERAVGGVASILITSQSILSGMWFPLETLSQGFVTFIKWLPFRSSGLLLQNVCNNAVTSAFGDFWQPLLITLAYAVAVYVVAVLCYRRKMKNI